MLTRAVLSSPTFPVRFVAVAQNNGSFTSYESDGKSKKDQRKNDKHQRNFSVLLPLLLSVNES